MPRILIVANAPVEGMAARFRDCHVDITNSFEDVPKMIERAIKESNSYDAVIFHWFSKKLLDIYPRPQG